MFFIIKRMNAPGPMRHIIPKKTRFKTIIANKLKTKQKEMNEASDFIRFYMYTNKVPSLQTYIIYR